MKANGFNELRALYAVEALPKPSVAADQDYARQHQGRAEQKLLLNALVQQQHTENNPEHRRKKRQHA